MRPRHPAPPDVQARWRAAGAWTDETLLDRLDTADAAQVAVVDGGERCTIADLRERSSRLAATLHSHFGVRPGDVVCWQLPNWWEACVLAFAIWRCGATASPITPTLRAREVGFILGQTGARLYVAPSEFRGTDYAALARAAGYEGDVLLVRSEGLPDTAAAPPSPVVDAGDAAVILWTSGTTSDPKGVLHTHQSLRVEADTIATAHDLHRGEALLLPMPVTHVAGLTYGVLLPVTSGVTAVLMDEWEPGRALELLERERVAVMISTPVFMRTMIDHPDFERTGRRSMRLFSLGGAGVAPAMVREGCEAFRCWCKRTYGSTEYPTLTTGALGDDPELDATTDGRLIGDAELRVVDPDTCADVGAGTPGELLARGPEMFSGYLDPALDDAAFLEGGWFRTGDLATFDGTHLSIVDRLKDVIIRGGENVSALEVESLIVTHPAVSEAACIAVPDPVMGERICAYVIAEDGAAPTLDAIREHLLAQGLARFKLPERLVVRDALPRTASGKVQKAPLREEQRHG